VISAGASIGQALAAQAPAERPPPGRLIDIGGFRLHLDCRGTGRQVVVIDVGAGGWSISFTHIQQAITDEARVCTYDRAGMGWSDLGPAPRTSDRMANELHALLRRAGVPAPYVLVGHSLGGLTMRAFAAARPDEVAGIVLVESAHEEQWKRLPSEAFAALGATLPRLRAAAAAARAGRLGPPQPGPVPQASREVQTIYAAAMTTPKPYEGFAAEIEGVMLDARAPVSPRPLGDLPLTVVTAGNSFAAFEGSGIPREAANGAWMQLQSELVGLSTRGVQFVIDSANHRIHATHPDFIVRAIRHMLRATRDTATRMGSGDEWDGIVRGDARSAETRKHPGKKWRR
jgi:pimeloyl-ACP methyl ester carboxylesterase